MSGKRQYLTKEDMLQFNGFSSIFKQNLRLGHTLEMSFADAIAITSDDKFVLAKKRNLSMVKKYVEMDHPRRKKNWNNRKVVKHKKGVFCE